MTTQQSNTFRLDNETHLVPLILTLSVMVDNHHFRAQKEPAQHSMDLYDGQMLDRLRIECAEQRRTQLKNLHIYKFFNPLLIILNRSDIL